MVNQKKNQLQQKKRNLQKKTLGKKGEQLTKKKLLQNNWTFLHENYHTKSGEIDLIFIDPKNILVFIEVKTRTNSDLGEPEEALTPTKKSNFKRAARIFVHENPKYHDYVCRLDVAAINFKDNRFTYYKNAIE